MQKRWWIVAVVVLGAVPVWAQPNNAGAMAPSDEIALAELERAIGGRTMLELDFKDLGIIAVTNAVAQSSELRFVAPSERMMEPLGVLDSRPVPSEMKWDGAVSRTDFWLALRSWGQAEVARRQNIVTQRIGENEPAPSMPVAAPGQQVTLQAISKWEQQRDKWEQQQRLRRSVLGNSPTLSANFEASAEMWKLVRNANLINGHSFNSWPCLVVASQFQRNQDFTLDANDPPEKQSAENAQNTSEKTGDAASLAEKMMVDAQMREVVKGGALSDSLSLNLMVYLEPKLQQRATMDVWVDEARDETGADLLPDWNAAVGSPSASYSTSGEKDSGMLKRVQLRPRAAKGRTLATLRGVVEVRYPMKLQEHQITNFNGPQPFSINTDELPVLAQFEPPQLKNGRLVFNTSLALESERGGRRIMENYTRRLRNTGNWRLRGTISLSSRSYATTPGSSFESERLGPLGKYLLPSYYTLVDDQGRVWRGRTQGGSSRLVGPDGRNLPITSPPTPPPDNFIYKEDRSVELQLMPQDSGVPNAQVALAPDELAKVRFTKATFTTESDWRTLEVPFEFHDLPLPPR